MKKSNLSAKFFFDQKKMPKCDEYSSYNELIQNAQNLNGGALYKSSTEKLGFFDSDKKEGAFNNNKRQKKEKNNNPRNAVNNRLKRNYGFRSLGPLKTQTVYLLEQVKNNFVETF